MAVTTQPLTRARARSATRAHGMHPGRAAVLFTTPFFVLYILFLLWPILAAARTSLFDASLSGHESWAGLRNYTDLLNDSNFWAAMWHTALFTLLSTPPLVLVALGLALLVSRVHRFQWLYRLSFFAPYVLPVSVVVLIWNWLFQPGFGLINSYLTTPGLSEGNWLRHAFVALVAGAVAADRGTGRVHLLP